MNKASVAEAVDGLSPFTENIRIFNSDNPSIPSSRDKVESSTLKSRGGWAKLLSLFSCQSRRRRVFLFLILYICKNPE